VTMFSTWCINLTLLSDQLIYVGALIFIAAKFFEGRTILTVGFDRLDTRKILVKGPDDENVVWIGSRYETSLEAEAIADTFRARLKESASV
jgi:hypothetical protein